MTWRQRWRRLVRVTSHAVPIALLFFVAAEWNGRPGQPRDTMAFHRAATAAAAGESIYEPIPPPGPHEFNGEWDYLYPPPLAALLSGLPEMRYRWFDRAWLVLNLIAFWALAACLGRMARGSWGWSQTALWGAALFFLPGTLLGIHLGNIDVMILALVAAGLAVPAAAGLTVGLAAAFKVTPVWPLLTLAVRRPRQTLPGLAAAVVISIGACLLAFGASGTVHLIALWTTDVMPTLGQGQFWGESYARLRQGGLHPLHYTSNLSLSFLPVQLSVLWGWWGYEGGVLPGLVRLYLTAIAIAGPLVAAWMTRRRSPTTQAAVVMAAAVLAAPIVRPYMLAVFFLVIAALRQERSEGQSRGDPSAPELAAQGPRAVRSAGVAWGPQHIESE